MGRKPTVNIASGNDTVAVQAGQVGSAGRSKDPKTPKPPAGKGRVTNVVSGNARVGVQTDGVIGDITISF
ncbi:hypothetical protein ACQP2X_08755 [Actinoplanes sp. CA-131856]